MRSAERTTTERPGGEDSCQVCHADEENSALADELLEPFLAASGDERVVGNWNLRTERVHNLRCSFVARQQKEVHAVEPAAGGWHKGCRWSRIDRRASEHCAIVVT